MEYWLHPITVHSPQRPLFISPSRVLRIARMAGYNKLVVAPLRGWEEAHLKAIPPNKVGAIEGSWHGLTEDDVFASDAWARVFGKRTEAEAALPHDNLFWGDAALVDVRMRMIRALFFAAIYSGHTPNNDVAWPGPYAWEVNPDHGMYGEEVFDTPGLLSVDLYHLTRPARETPHRQITTREKLIPYVERLVQRRGQDIVMVHLHLAAMQIVPFSLGVVPEHIRECFKILSVARGGNFGVAVQFLPPWPFNIFSSTSAAFLRTIRKQADALLFEGVVGGFTVPVYA